MYVEKTKSAFLTMQRDFQRRVTLYNVTCLHQQTALQVNACLADNICSDKRTCLMAENVERCIGTLNISKSEFKISDIN